MMRFIFGMGMAGLAVLTLAAGSSQGQVKLSDRVKSDSKLKYITPDLEATTFQGALRGSEIVLGGVITNVGKGAYEKGQTVTVSLTFKTKTPEPGYKALVRRPLKLRVVAIPKLAPNGTWTWQVSIPTRELPGQFPFEFLATISSDGNTQNNYKSTVVTAVN